MFDVAFDETGTWGIAVGEDLKLGGGYAVITDDGGDTWRLASQTFPAGVQAALSLGDGQFFVAGGEGDAWLGQE
jgi:hypothetical protein